MQILSSIFAFTIITKYHKVKRYVAKKCQITKAKGTTSIYGYKSYAKWSRKLHE